ncbi:MAG: NAD(P)/FAD-dependent oxidoreductase [Verrucomicrobiota bacterium]
MARSFPDSIHTVAILGGGPTASTLAVLLARAGIRVGLWHKPKAAPLIVGESLVPAIIPMLRKLGVEDEVRKYSMLKPGATFNLTPDIAFSFFFENLRGLPRYAYNVPRDKFDATLLEAAQKAGAAVFEENAEVLRVGNSDRVELSAATLAATGGFFRTPPDLVVDATGRVRLVPNLMGISSWEGRRKDTALFAHVDQAQLDYEGHVHTTRLDRGWSWRIPLPGRVSLGMVVPSEHLPQFGATKEERYDNLLRQDSMLKRVAGNAKRITPVLEYKNYQLVSERMVGDNWVLVGDTAGFIDPVFSSGLFLGMNGAFLLADAIIAGSRNALDRYATEATHHLKTWHEIVDYWYNGRLFTCFKVGQKLRDTLLVKLTFPHMNKHMGRIFGGAASNSIYSIGLLRFAMKYGLKNEDPNEFVVR